MSFNDKLSYTEHNVASPTSDFTIGFEDYALTTKDHINVTVNDIDAKDAGYTVTRKNNLVITLTPPVPSGVVRLQRETNIDTPFHRFTAGAKFVASNVDQNFTQILHSQQEVRNLFGFTQDYIQRTLDNFDLRIQGVEGIVLDLRQDYNNLDKRITKEVVDRKQGDQELKDYIDSTVNGITGEDFLPIHDRFVITESGRTQREKNGDVKSSRDFGLIPDTMEDQTAKLVSFFNSGGNLVLESGTYKAKGHVPTIYIKSNTNISALGAVIDFSEATNTTTGRIRAEARLSSSQTTVSANITKNSNTITVVDPSIFKVGDVVLITSTAPYSSDTTAGEVVKIASIKGNTLILYDVIALNYSMSNTVIEQANCAKNIMIVGLETRGRGSVDDVAGLNERGFQFSNLENLVFIYNKVHNFDRMGVLLTTCYNSLIKKNEISCSVRVSDTYEYIQYGIALADRLRYTVVEDNSISYCKHGIAWTSYNANGVAINTDLINNTIENTWAAAIATHKTNEQFTIEGNKIRNCLALLDVRVPNGEVFNNTVTNVTRTFLILRANASDLNIYDNDFDGATDAITSSEVEDKLGVNVRIHDNVFKNVTRYGIALTNQLNASIKGFSVDNNEFREVNGDLLNLVGGFVEPQFTSNKGFNNSNASGYGVRLSGTTDAMIDRNTLLKRIPVRLEGGSATTGTRIMNTMWDRAVNVVSVTAGSNTGIIYLNNNRLTSHILSVENNSVDIGTANKTVFVGSSSETTLSTITHTCTTGEVLTVMRTGNYAITLNNGGNMLLKSDITLDSLSTAISLVWNGSKFVELSRS